MVKKIINLLDSVDNDLQVSKWMRIFQTRESLFAVFKVGGDSLTQFSSHISESFSQLAQLDLYAPVVYGWGSALTKTLAENGITSLKHEATGLRITQKDDLPYLESVAIEHGNILVDSLKNLGVQAKLLTDVFSAKQITLDGVTSNHYTGYCYRRS